MSFAHAGGGVNMPAGGIRLSVIGTRLGCQLILPHPLVLMRQGKVRHEPSHTCYSSWKHEIFDRNLVCERMRIQHSTVVYPSTWRWAKISETLWSTHPTGSNEGRLAKPTGVIVHRVCSGSTFEYFEGAGGGDGGDEPVGFGAIVLQATRFCY